MKYVTRGEYCRAQGMRSGDTGKCEDAWTVIRIAHENGRRNKDTIIAAGTLLGLSEGNIKAEWANWRKANAHMFREVDGMGNPLDGGPL